MVDSGLSLGRSSRVGWGPNGEMVSLRGVYGKEKEKEKGKEGKSDTVRIEKLRLLEVSTSSSSDPSSSTDSNLGLCTEQRRQSSCITITRASVISNPNLPFFPNRSIFLLARSFRLPQSIPAILSFRRSVQQDADQWRGRPQQFPRSTTV